MNVFKKSLMFVINCILHKTIASSVILVNVYKLIPNISILKLYYGISGLVN